MRFLSHIRSLQLGIIFLDYEYDREAAYVSPCGQLKATVLASSQSRSRESRGNPCASLVCMLICAPRWMGSELRVLAAALLACSMLPLFHPFLFVYFWPLNGWRVIRLFAIRTWDFQHHWPRVTVIFFLRSLPSIADYRNCLPRLGLRAFLPSVKSWMAEGNAKQPALSSERVKETWP